MGTFLASIKVALMSLAHDMLDEGEKEDTWVYQVWLFGFCADVMVGYLSVVDVVTAALGPKSWARRKSKNMVTVLSVLCFQSYMSTMVLVGVVCGHAGVLPGRSTLLAAMPYFTMLAIAAISPVVYWIRDGRTKKGEESNA
ncbi:hypothetical protein B0J17DRAFT_217124 [Rhizoctonia solani]|nr:hypothetical protein B0J17DRAFT_217124 [Rhizoctonia solani]